jgi:hypothetical protein
MLQMTNKRENQLQLNQYLLILLSLFVHCHSGGLEVSSLRVTGSTEPVCGQLAV